MSGKNDSPEKRLLKIIEGQKETTGPAPLVKSRQLLSLAAFKSRFSFLKERFRHKRGFKMQFLDLAAVNVILQCGAAILVIYLGISVRAEYKRVRMMSFEAIDGTAAQAQAGPPETVLLSKPLDFYLEKARGRDIFKMADIPQEVPVVFRDTEAEKKPSKLAEIARTLKLVGISWSNEPDAMIEDERLQRTYFVKTGSMINEIKIQAIFRDKVILRYETEEIELR